VCMIRLILLISVAIQASVVAHLEGLTLIIWEITTMITKLGWAIGNQGSAMVSGFHT